MATVVCSDFNTRILKGFVPNLTTAQTCDIFKIPEIMAYVNEIFTAPDNDGYFYDVPFHLMQPGDFFFLEYIGRPKRNAVVVFGSNGFQIIGDCPDIDYNYEVTPANFRPPNTAIDAVVAWNAPLPPDANEEFADDGDGDDTTTEEGLFDFGGEGGAGLIGWRSSNLISINRLLISMAAAAAHDLVRNRSKLF